jgi:phosphate transport system substrate-binding protein
LASKRLYAIVVAEVVLVLVGVYGYTSTFAPGLTAASTSTEPVTLTGAGATLSYPLLTIVASNYEASHPGTAINYQPFGSIAGISQLLVETVDFCVTYPPMSPTQRASAPGLPLHIPESISAVVVAYNVPGITSLRLTGNVTADIFLGNVKTWNDPEITNLNPGENFPNQPINTWHMTEAEGTTFVFTSYLAIVSPTFRSQLGPGGTSVSWPIGLYVPTDGGVASKMKSTPYSIGYMELSYAIQDQLPYAQIQNSAGNWITPSTESSQAALIQLPTNLPGADQDWSNVNLLNKPGPDAYPLVTFTYLIIYQNLSILPSMDLAKAKALVGFIWYLVHDGQSLGAPLGYVPLPTNAVQIDEAGLHSVVFQGQFVISGQGP